MEISTVTFACYTSCSFTVCARVLVLPPCNSTFKENYHIYTQRKNSIKTVQNQLSLTMCVCVCVRLCVHAAYFCVPLCACVSSCVMLLSVCVCVCVCVRARVCESYGSLQVYPALCRRRANINAVCSTQIPLHLLCAVREFVLYLFI